MAPRTVANDWSRRSITSVWHPFTQAMTSPLPIPMVKGSGAYLYAEDGTRYLDAISSWWVNLHGHCHPHIVNAIFEQARTLEHVMFAGYTHPQAVTLAERLLKILPHGLSKVFYSDNGSTAVETALKMAFQAADSGKKLLAFQNGYHGDTFGAMSAGGKGVFNRPFQPYLFEIQSIIPPYPGKEEESWQQFNKVLVANDTSAFIFEPMIQGVGGMLQHCPKILAKMVAACQERGIYTIADEVMTGFGRTGPLFASQYLEVTPDMICLAKAITGGFLPLAATVVKECVYQKFLSTDLHKALLHGHSYTANPLACAAANANLDLLLTKHCDDARARIENSHLRFRDELKEMPHINRCEVLGTLLVIEYKTEAGYYHFPHKQKLIDHFFSKKILIRPFGNVLHVMPPYCITTDELEHIYTVIKSTLKDFF